MRRMERKRNFSAGALCGLLVTILSFACMLFLLTLLLKNGSINDSLLRLLLPLSCLLAGAIGSLFSLAAKEDRVLALLLSGTIPSGCLLCSGLIFIGHGMGDALLWNAAAFIVPALAALIPGKKKTRHRRK